ncbi:uncharacterized protein ASPGLDRAFT_585760 [Aspergillus glaucus CBS 516.65]|uniref:Heterokaryon incompatibility domain-containing protein n=1 Tax=Aspergillus glaucus CBS 516.65 TaxID=1160497 RepID=A0A1L9VEM2_ASPGL|nr:hypothetical protein ASPGLDRAFT_585760 [Aspergillus glaucus CBS 516.65]OJJ82272.1 hypothetical protein ASPGLDRAFT_585760 [Aspergillus glaucus CBS 516.65]
MVELDMNTTTIPPNDPESPRWLLDLEKWEILPYTEVPQETLDAEGYGVVSYTWGYIQDSGNSAPDPPRGLLWDVPGVTEWSLSEAKEAMKMIGTRYIWWDWMCVPQRVKGMKELSRELGEVQAQEIGKQMHIYGKARKSIVWLHSTSWTKESALKELLHLQSPEADSKEPIDMQKHVDQVTVQLDAARSEEHWLCSGWTLQEGVLLHETDLIDGSGNALPGPDFFMSDQATVCDLTVPITRLAYELAIGYFIKSQGHEPDVGTPCPHTTYLLSKMPDIWLRRSLQTFMASGFVGFWKNSPLDILSGKRGRKFGNIKDSCWALVGALGIDDIEVTYDKDVSMEERQVSMGDVVVAFSGISHSGRRGTECPRKEL